MKKDKHEKEHFNGKLLRIISVDGDLFTECGNTPVKSERTSGIEYVISESKEDLENLDMYKKHAPDYANAVLLHDEIQELENDEAFRRAVQYHKIVRK